MNLSKTQKKNLKKPKPLNDAEREELLEIYNTPGLGIVLKILEQKIRSDERAFLNTDYINKPFSQMAIDRARIDGARSLLSRLTHQLEKLKEGDQ